MAVAGEQIFDDFDDHRPSRYERIAAALESIRPDVVRVCRELHEQPRYRAQPGRPSNLVYSTMVSGLRDFLKSRHPKLNLTQCAKLISPVVLHFGGDPKISNLKAILERIPECKYLSKKSNRAQPTLASSSVG